MKKFLAVLLAALMLCSVMSVAVFATAGGDVTTTAPASTGDDAGDQKTELPSWLTELIARLKVVLMKILLKLGIKLVF